MGEYRAPGVYVEEVAGGSRPIQAVGTSTAGFVGEAPRADAVKNQAVAIENWSQFLERFGNGTTMTPLAHAVYGFLLNGGRRCYVVNVGKGGQLVGGAQGRKGLDVLAERDEIAIVAAPGYTDAASYDAILTHCRNVPYRVAILDPPREVSAIDSLTQPATAPAADPPGPGGPAAGGLGPQADDKGRGAFYFPWIRVRDPLSSEPSQNSIVAVPPSGHLAGIYARSDATRGVHKAPANEPIYGALGLTYAVTQAEQEELNPAGVNCIRFLPEGIRVWGARTVAKGASEWRYLNVRRLFNMIERSIAESTRWIVFEPNDETLWKAIRRDVRAFLTLVWRDGALMGQTPEEAFFVQCDAETNPPEVIDAGRVVTKIGIAPVKPAEFIIFQIAQHAGGAEVTAQGGANG